MSGTADVAQARPAVAKARCRVGYDAECTIRYDGQTAKGKAVLEQKDLVFRGPFRLVVPLATVTRASARDGTLVVQFGGRRAEIDLGAPAERWADRITNPPSRLRKLGVKPGMRVALVNMAGSAGDGFREELQQAGAQVLARPGAGTDAVFLGADVPADLDRLAGLKRHLQPAGALWIVRRKGQTAVSEQASMAAGKKAGLVDVKVVSYSDTHTAEKYVIPVAARGGAGPSSPVPRKRGSASSRARS